MKKSIISLIILISIITIIPSYSFASTYEDKSVEIKPMTEQDLKYKIDKLYEMKEKNLQSTKEQLLELGKIDQFEAHKKVLEDLYNDEIAQLKSYYNNDLSSNFQLSQGMYWRNGGTIHYKPTELSLTSNVLEYYDNKQSKLIFQKYVIEEYLKELRDWKGFVLNKILTNIPDQSIGFAASVFSDAADISRFISRRAIDKAVNFGNGCIIVHYNIGPTMNESSVAVWSWESYPYVNRPSSSVYNVIEYYQN